MGKTNRRAISIVLAVLMAFSALFVGTTSASAAGTAQTNSATLTINGEEYSVGDTVTYTTTLQNRDKFSSISGHVAVSGNTSALALVTASQSAACPALTNGSVVVNFEPNDGSSNVYFNALDASSGYSFSTEETLITLEYKVVSAGGAVNISTSIDEIYDMDTNVVSSAKTATTITSSATSGVVIDGTAYQKGDVIHITVRHQNDTLVSGVSGFIKYDSSYLKLYGDYALNEKNSLISPKLSSAGSFMVNREYVDETDGVGIAYSGMNVATCYDFTTESELAVAQFEVIAESGTTTLSHKILEEYDIDLNDISGTITTSVTLVSSASTDPTATDPTTTDPTVPTTTDPTVPTTTDPTVPTTTDPTVPTTTEPTVPTTTDPTVPTTTEPATSPATDPTTAPTVASGVTINGTKYQKGDIIQLTVKHQADKTVAGISGFIKYDSNYVKLSGDYTTVDSVFSQKLSSSGSFLVNRAYVDETLGVGIAYSAMDAGTGYDFKTETVIATVQFEVIAESGTTSITHKIFEEYDMDINDLSGTTSYAVSIVTSAEKTYTVRYNSNGGKGSMSDVTLTYGVTTQVSANKFTYTGKTFKGWTAYRAAQNQWRYTNGTKSAWYKEGSQPDGWTKYVYKPTAKLTNLTAINNDTVTLYAQWEDNTYTVTFDANGGSGSMEDMILTYGTSVQISQNQFTFSGKAFGGWTAYREAQNQWRYTNGTSTGWYEEGSQPAGWTKYVYKATEKISALTDVNDDTVILYAQWETSGYTVAFNANGGKGSMDNMTLTYGVTSQVSPNKFTYTGKTFFGWTAYRAAQNQWRYTNGTSSAWYKEGSQPDGWTKYVYKPTAKLTNLTKVGGDTVTLYAQWEDNTYTVTYDANGGKGTMEDMILTYGVTVQVSPNKFTYGGKSFNGWTAYRSTQDQWRYTNGTSSGWYAEGSQPDGWTKYVYKSTAKLTSLTGINDDTVTLYAQWSSGTYTVKYDANGGKGTMEDSILTYGVTSQVRPNKFTYAGKTFKGWTAYRTAQDQWRYTNGKSTGWYKEGSQPAGWTKYVYKATAKLTNLTSIVDDTVVFYAQWADKTYTVTYDANGGTGSMDDVILTYGVTAQVSPNKFTYAGKTFTGWTAYRTAQNQWRYTNGRSSGWYEEGSQPAGWTKYVYKSTAKLTSLTGIADDTVILYAQWK